MKKMNKQSGFTLIEIIVVLIILGVLAAIALPNLFSNVARSGGAEAIASFSSMKAPLEACGQKNATYAGCSTTTLGTSGRFNYFLGDSACANLLSTTAAQGDAQGWCIKAYLSPAVNGATYIQLVKSGAAGTANAITCSGAGAYAGVC